MRDDWYEVHCHGDWKGLLGVRGSFGSTARQAAVAFLRDMLEDPPPNWPAGRPLGKISVHQPGWVGACGVWEVKVEATCIRFRRTWPKLGRWQLAAGWPPRRDPGPTCAELGCGRPHPKFQKELPMFFDEDELDPDFEFAANADVKRALRGQPDDPAEALPAELARWADDGGPAVELE